MNINILDFFKLILDFLKSIFDVLVLPVLSEYPLEFMVFIIASTFLILGYLFLRHRMEGV